MIKRLLQLVDHSRKLLAASVIFGCLGGLVLIAEAYYIATIVDDVSMQGFGFAEVKLMLALLLGIIILRGCVQIYSEYMSTKLAQKVKSELRLQLIEKLGKLGPQYGKKQKTGELASTVYEGVEQLENYLAKYVPQIALSMFIPFAVFVVVLGQDLFSAFVYGVTLPLLVVFMILIGKYTKYRTDKQYKLLGRLGGHFQEILRSMETLKMFNRSKDQYSNIATISEEHRKSTMATLRLAFLSAFVMELFSTISTAIVAVFLGLRLIEGEIQFFHAFLILLLTPEFYAPIRALGTQFHSGMNGASAATRIFQILDEKEQGLIEQENAKKWSEAFQDESTLELECKDLFLQFEGYTAPALQSINFTLKPGQKLALVGATGAGKSTLLDIVQGFIKPSSGQIIINGIHLEQLSIEDWRKQLAVVSQHSYLFHGTVKENIVGTEEQAITDEQIWQALEWAGAKDFVSHLAQGLDTLLTDQIQLSGGQIQRLTLARAYLRQNAKLILLDEATTGLDIYHEQIVKSHLHQLLKHKSAIIVTHQLEIIEDADYVIVLKEGSIVEQGTPEQLAKQNGIFRSMLEANSWSKHARPIEHINVSPVMQNHAKGLSSSTFNKQNQSNSETQHLLESKPFVVQEQTLSFIEMLNIFKKMLTFFKKHNLFVVLAISLAILTIAANIGLMGTSGYLIAKSALRPENVLMVYIPVIGVRFFGISRAVFRYLERLASHNVTFKALHGIRLWFYRSIEPRGMTLLKNNRGGNILGAVISHIEQLQYFYLRIFSPSIVYLFIVLGSVLFMMVIHPRLSLALLVMLLIAGIAVPYSNYVKNKRYGAKTVSMRITLYEQTIDMLRGTRILQQFGWFNSIEKQMMNTQQELNSIQLKEHWQAAYHSGLMTMVTQLGMWVLLLLSIPLIRDGSIEPYMLPAIIMITLASFEAAAPLPQAFQSSLPVALSAKHLFELAEETREPGIQQQPLLPVDSKNIMSKERAIDEWNCKFENVSFKYEDSDKFALKHIDFSLAIGKRVAIVGESSAGKSTVVQALMKLRPISTGDYSINGQSSEAMHEEAVREHFSVVSQQVQLFNASVLNNLKLGNKEASLETVREAARIAEIDEFIMSLPKGYNTLIGEYGETLSGGQKQRLALARAIIQGHAALLFDEPATGLDALTEQAFLSNLSHIVKKHAVLWITHRLYQVTHMDEILVLKDGCIVERGTHQQLLDLNGHYYKMWCLERAHDWQHVAVNSVS